jgi:hypothetical protein
MRAPRRLSIGGEPRCFASARLFEDEVVKVENRVEGLNLGAGRHIAPQSQVGEKLFQLFLAGEVRRDLTQGRDVTAKPEDVTVLRGKCFVLPTDDLTHPFKGLSCIHSF